MHRPAHNLQEVASTLRRAAGARQDRAMDVGTARGQDGPEEHPAKGSVSTGRAGTQCEGIDGSGLRPPHHGRGPVGERECKEQPICPSTSW